jgi:hypothetical protein
MQKNHLKALDRYIPFRKFHIAPLSGLTPDDVKWAAELACTKYRDREDIKLNTAQNFIAQRLGFEGGYAGYLQEFKEKVVPFMQFHGLHRREDLFSSPEPNFAHVALRPRQLSDALFQHKLNKPCHVFTGYNVDWFEINNRHFRHNVWHQHPSYDRFVLPFEVVAQEYEKAAKDSAELAMLKLEAAVEACSFTVKAAVNMLGTQLFRFSPDESCEDRFLLRLYQDKNCDARSFNDALSKAEGVLRIFRLWIEKLNRGWVEVVPFNSKLVFLKGQDGTYDFLFPGFRDELFNHNTYSPYLQNTDIPKSHDQYHFRRWLYFGFDGWLEQEQHRAEITLYNREHGAIEYPGEEEVLKQHLLLSRSYRPPKKTAGKADGFFRVCLVSETLFVSNLISIGEFKRFMQDNPEYALYSREPAGVDRWETVNCDDDQSLPASVTWYDANAYAAWISRKRKLPVRLLSEEEYLEIACSVISPDYSTHSSEFHNINRQRICDFYLPSGERLNDHPPYMPESDFQRLELRYNPEMVKWETHTSGLKLMVSYHFGEWLNGEGIAVNSRSLTSLCSQIFRPLSGKFSAKSTGKYKSKKIGFRLCYLADSSGSLNQT